LESDSRFAVGTVDYYEVGDKLCVVLEPIAGRYGYPGYSKDEDKMKIAVDPRTLQVVDLE